MSGWYLFLSILVLIVIFEHVLCLILVSFLLVLNVYLPARVAQRRTMWLWTTFQKCSVTAISLLFKFCVRYIFATFLSLKESTCKTRKMFFIWLQNLFPFSRKSKFRTLDIQILWCHQMPNHKKRDTFNWISLELNTAC